MVAVVVASCSSADNGGEARAENGSSLSSTDNPDTTVRSTTTTTATASSEAATSTTSSPSTTATERPACSLADGVNTRTHSDQERTVWFHPAISAEPAPVLVLFHGFAGIADEFAANTGLTVEAPAAGVSLVVPVGLGTPPTWEIGNGPFDDNGFIANLIDELAGDPCVDAERIWLAGYSAGAGFVGIQACAIGDQLAGVVMNAAAAPALCTEPTGFDMIFAHGTKDRVVDYGGLAIGGDTLSGTPALAAGWAERLDCNGPTYQVSRPAADPEADDAIALEDVAELPDFRNEADRTTIRERWTDCRGQSGTVDMLSYVGGGHRWPGRDRVGGEGLIPTTPDLTCVILAAMNEASDALADC